MHSRSMADGLSAYYATSYRDARGKFLEAAAVAGFTVHEMELKGVE